MRSALLACLFFMALRVICLPADAADSLPQRLEAIRAETRTPGAAIAVVRRGHEPEFFTLGQRSLDTPSPVSPDTVFQIGSVTKPLVSTTMAILAARGEVSFDADVRNLLQSVTLPPGSTPITLTHLLTHTAGLSERNLGLMSRSASDVPDLAEYLRRRLPPFFAPPGRVFAYSNHGVGLAALAVQDLTRRDFRSILTDELFAPLAMSRSTAVLPLPPHLTGDAATGHRVSSDRVEATGTAYRNVWPAGGVSTTARDMARFMLAQLSTEDDGPISAPVRALLHTPCFSVDPDMPGVCRGFFEQRTRGRRGIGHAGQTLGFTAALILFPEEGLGVFVAANTMRSAFCQRAIDALLDEHLGPLPPDIVPPASPTLLESPINGAYRSTRTGFRTFENISSLFSTQIHTQATDAGLLVSGDLLSVAKGRIWTDGRTMFATVDPATNRLSVVSTFAGIQILTMFDPLPAIDTPWFVNEFWLSALPLAHALAVVSPLPLVLIAAVRAFRRRPASASSPVVATMVLALLGAIGFASGLGPIRAIIHAAGSGGGDLIFDTPLWFRILAWGPTLSVCVTPLLAWIIVQAWRRRRWHIAWRLLLTLGLASQVAWAWFVIHWDMVPPTL